MEYFQRLRAAVQALNELCEGSPFVIHVDLKDLLPNHHMGEATARELGGVEILLRLEPVKQTMRELSAMLLKRNQLLIIGDRITFDTTVPWTTEGLALLEKLEREIADVDLFIPLTSMG